MQKGNNKTKKKKAASKKTRENVSKEVLAKANDFMSFSTKNPEYADLLLKYLYETPYGELSAIELATPRKDGTVLWDIMKEELKRRIKDPKEVESARKFVEELLREDAPEKSDKKKLPIVGTKKARKADYPIDKPNNTIWNYLQTDNSGQLSFNFDLGENKKTHTKATAIFSLDFNDFEKEKITLSKSINSYDKRVMIAAWAQTKDSENFITTVSQIYNAMGYTGNINARTLKKINDSLTKMGFSHLYYDNEIEAAAYKGKPHLKYDGALLPFERVTAIVGGNETDSAIHLFREPPLITFARERKQITSISIKLLQSPINKTDDNMQLEDYLFERIARAKKPHSKSTNVINFDTVFKHCNIDKSERVKRARTKETMQKYLTYWVECEYIKSFELTKDKTGIAFYF